ncbi:MAG: ankyrin repeat domain-containing protein, partial [Candidatus Cardinium sp.]|nr:ankyrin repeat domain-containing protein [Candidatus Cardinium sp.]
DPHCMLKNGTPLHAAASGGYEKIVQLLLEKEAILDTVDNAQCTPLHLAAKKGNIAIVRALVTEAANANMLNHRGDTPLQLAMDNKHVAVVKFLNEMKIKGQHNHS